ncbi:MULTISPECIES: hypothetical protein [Bacillota]|jgi:hypothetical protein|uniref:Uncharacterized protein n=3 Tax=Amedibacillus TaxID=2749846 RepID=A0A7G9GSZ6_9FIRM|nr:MULTISPECIES: hypothetical protein [Bacillota]QNM13928.1 hypothetical protein H9Q80_08320 [[Eubacterium] hominis]MCH4283961.1 hypothetical protein [Amedibacillus hominis]RGB56840.1 hypothetical protein DW271_06890 [Absiella sp. AM22-9]RGB60720.1 hypothetical protein DW120_07985 [Absiella sp. AM10-20]RGC44489.1 hypothetical protein DW761_19650 [Absiella sp. AM29-15]
MYIKVATCAMNITSGSLLKVAIAVKVRERQQQSMKDYYEDLAKYFSIYNISTQGCIKQFPLYMLMFLAI